MIACIVEERIYDKGFCYRTNKLNNAKRIIEVINFEIFIIINLL